MKGKSLGRVVRPVVPFLLPVRPQRTWWQTITAWLRQGWQRLRVPRMQILPPLVPARHKPFPNRPHQQRRQAVFAALDAAPAGLTRRQLIAHVRAVTGVGCSEKLITQWRQGRRCGDGVSRRSGEKRRGPKGGMFVLVCLGLNACATMPMTVAPSAPEITISPAPNDPSEIAPISSLLRPRLLRIKLTINTASDLLVKTDDEVKTGQILTNRSHERQRLLIQRRILATQAQQMEAQLTTAAEALALLKQRGTGLPPISFASEHAAITKAEAEAAVTTRQVEVQQQKLSVVSSQLSVASASTSTVSANDRQCEQEKQRTTDLGQLTLIRQHETAKLTFAQDAARQAAAEIALQKAKLTSAQETRAFQEKQHALAVVQHLLAARQQQQQAVLARAELRTKLAALDLQLDQLAAVRAPFSGTIRRIDYEDMHDQTLTVLVYLAVHQ